MGDKCDQCMDGYKLFSSVGCIPCNCNEIGSLNTTCEKVAGQCPCKVRFAILNNFREDGLGGKN